MTHTAGPWRVEEGTTLIWGNCDPDDKTTWGMGYPVAHCEQPRQWSKTRQPTADEQDANARLIAAAPELLAALSEIVRLSLVIKTAVEFSDAHIKEPGARRWDEVAGSLRQGCAAIAKAEAA